jgi:hypothetical protein
LGGVDEDLVRDASPLAIEADRAGALLLSPPALTSGAVTARVSFAGGVEDERIFAGNTGTVGTAGAAGNWPRS